MTETAGMSAEDAAAAARAAEQARIRKERREAKIKAGGSARLNRITGLGGGVQRDPIPDFRSPSPSPAPPPAEQQQQQQQQQHADPEEVDISQHYYQPATTNRVPPPPSADTSNSNSNSNSDEISEEQLRQMMLGFDRPNAGAGSPFPSSLGGPPPDDPMMKMLSQMLGGGSAPNNNNNNSPNPFAGGAAPFGGMQAPPPPPRPDTYTAAWRLAHLALALGLGLYAALYASFTGTRVARERAAALHDQDQQQQLLHHHKTAFLWTFATAETVLLTSRALLDRGRAAPRGGIVRTAMGLMPDGRWKGYLGVGMRYAHIFSTVRSDIMVCVFVLGVCAWARGES